MAKIKTRYLCNSCGADTPKWMGKCPECGAWNSLEEQLVQDKKNRMDLVQRYGHGDMVELLRLQEIAYTETDRLKTGLGELDRALGGGLVPGSLVLLGGEPGIGKSTLLLQSAFHMAEKQGQEVIYVSGEESAQQIKSRAQRLGFDQSENFFLLAETEMQTIVPLLDQRRPAVAILDSIQAVYDSRLESPPGGISQVKNTCNLLLKLAKQQHICIWIIGHVNKDGDIAGPKVLEHMVDAVLYFEGERYRSFRLMRTIKNRFGATHEVGVFEMTGVGLEAVENPSALFLAEYTAETSGSAVGVTMEGTRPLLVEIQALSYSSFASFPKRSANGISHQRLIQILAVLEKRVGLNLSKSDVLVNVVGGLTIEEPAADLAVAMALISGVRDIALDGRTVYLGEVGLAGEIRSVAQLERRLLESCKLGFTRAIVPCSNLPLKEKIEGMEIIGVKKLTEALRTLKGSEKGSKEGTEPETEV
ncbi:DNA repair protein RadA [bacterium (Candidatus Blackallbacteria) CG17_big_fil_post_rev_8_21_14_2_50_48_46]|uniref:DNA repair protein RadA n=1 Tax=bacterium (Candidatus Blackallbacteria) CG17_big_fil_post_rev_8_21_14_2_50_48_46 TaxID=2014261 RepID=A0A2M7G366_9BACT|nr:MAG: DNA repair protein RadA [bacterium (Candidatus Blackallbacteria) CG18_big_fil_WC_8_21_14_2_50_49_26]PIW16265.1 MAG: DNA repair protein RadA [bacterium (Candidatus Blackallbacteria) CG17_big_fil_post_rev_8_21_14_2_50_48_46]PIW49854.1 MAG: DNA repair protein RadA [bacterium (Candidatus Blackallbacteria) CG13_big_fil_rev_8_21_14_2_50_49_14]